MKKRMLALTVTATILANCMIACSDGRKDKEDSQDILFGQETESESPIAIPGLGNDVDLKKYAAHWNNGFVEEDRDTCIELCQDACNEFIHAVQEKRKPDFSNYIINPNLLEYMGYKVKAYPHKLGILPAFRCDLFLVGEDYVLLKGGPYKPASIANPSGENVGSITFLLKIENGRIWIAEWHFFAEGVLDESVVYRHIPKYDAVENADFWENSEKYGPVLEMCRKMFSKEEE